MNLQIEESTELGNSADLTLVEARVRVVDIPKSELMSFKFHNRKTELGNRADLTLVEARDLGEDFSTSEFIRC